MNCRAVFAVVLLALPAHAVVVRGRVTDPLGRPLPGARVQLISGPRNMADAITGPDGSYEIRSAASGRFLLLASSALNARYAAVQIGTPFYAGRVDIVEQDVFLDPAYLTPQVSTQTTLLPTPMPQLAETSAQVAADQFLTEATPLTALRQLPSALVVQQGTAGTPAELYLRGAGPQTVKVQVAGVAAEDLGGGFNFATLSTLGLGAVEPSPTLELTPGALPLNGLDAEGGVLTVGQTRATQVRPSLTVSGDAGNLASFRGQGEGEITRKRADLRGGFSRFDTDSGDPALRFHLAAAEANVGYNISAGTSLRLQVRREVTGAPLALPSVIFALQPLGEDLAQNLYSSLNFDTITTSRWHNRLSYGLARKRRQVKVFSLPVPSLPVTLDGANGFTVSGVPAYPPLPAREDLVTDRDQGSYQTDYPFTQNHAGVLRLSYVDERAADLLPVGAARFEIKHIAGAGGLQGNLFAKRLHGRLFYETSGLVDHSASLGWLEAPRVGLTVVPVYPGTRRFRGTTLHVTAATGFGEPGTAALKSALATQGNARAPRSRTLSLGVDQVVLPQKLTLRATYFHSQFSHQEEVLAFARVSPTLGYRAQGIEMAVHYQPFPRVYVAGGYTYLAALVEQTAQVAAFNPALGPVKIGALGALAGSRPFDRPPHSGWLVARFTGERLSAALEGSLAGRSDSSSGLAQTQALLLPNRDLSPGYVALNASAMYRFGMHVSVYTQLDNLLDNRHIAPFGFLSTPFLVRTGLRLRLGGD